MNIKENIRQLQAKYLVPGSHADSDYFGLIKELVQLKNKGDTGVQSAIDATYALVQDEIETNGGTPRKEITFGTSGWRGVLGNGWTILLHRFC